MVSVNWDFCFILTLLLSLEDIEMRRCACKKGVLTSDALLALVAAAAALVV